MDVALRGVIVHVDTWCLSSETMAKEGGSLGAEAVSALVKKGIFQTKTPSKGKSDIWKTFCDSGRMEVQ